MSHRATNGSGPARAGGFALLVLLGIVGIGSVGLLLAVNSFVPPLAGTVARVDQNLGDVASAARTAFARSGAFPADLDALASAGGLPADGAWRRDPWVPAQDLDCRLAGRDLRLRSRGPDRRLGTADDEVLDVAGEDLLRGRQRARLRLLRALYVRALLDAVAAVGGSGGASGNGNSGGNGKSNGNGAKNANANAQANANANSNVQGGGAGIAAGNGAGGAGAAPSGLLPAMRAYARAQRAWLTADAAERVVLGSQKTTAAATIAAAQAYAGWSLPAAPTGAGGLMERLARPDGSAVDGAGRPLQLHALLGVVAVGSDRVGGTDDDM